MSNITIDARAYPIDEPQGNTLAFANIAIKTDGEELAAIRGIRVVDSNKGPFVSMPQSKDKDGEFHDIAFPLNGDLRKEITAAVLDEAYRQAELSGGERGYEKLEAAENGGISADSVALDIRVYPVAEPKGGTLAFASAAFSVDGEDVMAIRGIRVVDGEKGQFVSMPQSKDKNGEYHDIAFPLSGDLRKEMNKAILAEFDKSKTAEKKQGIGNRLAEDAKKSAQNQKAAPEKQSAAKGRAPGLE